MNPWLMIVDLFRALLFAVAHLAGGSLGVSILIVSAIIRVALLPRGTFASMLVQAPIYGALYSAIAGAGRGIRGFLWVRDLAAPDVGVAFAAAALAALAARLDPNATAASRAWVAAAAVAFVFAWRIAAGVGLYWVASNVVGVGQSLVLRLADGRSTRAGERAGH